MGQPVKLGMVANCAYYFLCSTNLERFTSIVSLGSKVLHDLVSNMTKIIYDTK